VRYQPFTDGAASMEEWSQVVRPGVAMAYGISEDTGEVRAEYTDVDLSADLWADSDKDIAITWIWGKSVKAVIR